MRTTPSERGIPYQTKPVLRKALERTDRHLVITTGSGKFEIPREKCSDKLANASAAERGKAELPPAGHGIHWLLLDEDLAVGPLIRVA